MVTSKHNNLTHPMDIAGRVRLIQWSKIPKDTTFEFLLTAFSQAKTEPYAKHGGYLFCSAKPCQDYEIFQVLKGEHLILQFAYKTFINTLMSLPIEMQKECSRKNMSEYDDLYIKFQVPDQKKNNCIKIFQMERKQGTEQQLQEIEDMYKII